MRTWSYFRYSASSASVAPPRGYVFCDVHENRLSPCTNQRSSGKKIASFSPESVWPFSETFTPPDTDDRCVEVESPPETNATLPATPPLMPVDGFDPTDGATTKNGLCVASDTGSSVTSSAFASS